MTLRFYYNIKPGATTLGQEITIPVSVTLNRCASRSAPYTENSSNIFENKRPRVEIYLPQEANTLF